MTPMGAADAVCPSCAASDPHRIGVLPDVRLFAGTDIDEALPNSSLYRCRKCGLRFRYPVLETSQYAALYDNDRSDVWQDAPSDRPDWALVIDYVAQHA